MAALPVLGAILYGVSPLDAIPDLLPLIGIVDDSVILVMMVLIAVRWYLAGRRGVTTRRGVPVRVGPPPLPWG